MVLEAGATPLREPYRFPDGALFIAWAADPEGHPIQVAQRLRANSSMGVGIG